MADAATLADRTPAATARTSPITVSLINDYELVVNGLAAGLAPFADRITIIETEIGGQPDRVADIGLFDTFASRRNSLDRARQLVDQNVVDHVVLFTWDASPTFLDVARTIGVSGVVLKSQTMSQLVASLEQVVDGTRVGFPTSRRGRGSADGLSSRELEVLALLAAGLTNQEIADELFLSANTVKSHVARLYRHLGVKNRAQAAVAATDHGVGPPTTGSRTG